MFLCRITIAAYSFILFCTLTNYVRAKTRQITRINTKLDIVLMYDESTSMKGRLFGGWNLRPIDLSFVWAAAQEWIVQYGNIKGTEQSRFAVIGCKATRDDNSDEKPHLYLDGTGLSIHYETWGEKIYGALQVVNKTIYTTNNEYDNVIGCARSVREFVLQPTKGDRMDAPNVVFYITDCYFFRSNLSSEEMRKLIAQTAGFLIVCAERQSNKDLKIWDHVKDLVNNDMRKLYEYETKEETVRRMNEALPKITETVEDCEYNDFTTTQYCQIVPSKGCIKIKYPNIIKYPTQSEDAYQCPKNETILCGNKDCDCDKNPWLEVQCCDKVRVFRRDVSHQPTCDSQKKDKDDKCSNPCSGVPVTSKPVPPTPKPEPPTPRPEPPTPKPEPPTPRPEPPTPKPEPPTPRPEPPTPKPEPPTPRPEPPTLKPVPSTSKPEPPTSKKETSTQKPEPPTVKPAPPTSTTAKAPVRSPHKPLTKRPTVRPHRRSTGPPPPPGVTFSYSATDDSGYDDYTEDYGDGNGNGRRTTTDGRGGDKKHDTPESQSTLFIVLGIIGGFLLLLLLLLVLFLVLRQRRRKKKTKVVMLRKKQRLSPTRTETFKSTQKSYKPRGSNVHQHHALKKGQHVPAVVTRTDIRGEKKGLEHKGRDKEKGIKVTVFDEKAKAEKKRLEHKGRDKNKEIKASVLDEKAKAAMKVKEAKHGTQKKDAKPQVKKVAEHKPVLKVVSEAKPGVKKKDTHPRMKHHKDDKHLERKAKEKDKDINVRLTGYDQKKRKTTHK